jgi:hypothetical protein
VRNESQNDLILAIDRFDGTVLSQQLEEVTE